VYSPDGEWVVFTSNRSGTLDIWAISIRTGMLRQVTDHSADDMDPNYTRDAKHLIWSSNRSGHFEIWIAEPDGNSAKQLTKHAADSENPVATPDGWIFYVNSDNSNSGNTGLWKIRPDGSQDIRVLSGDVGFPEPSPNGQFLALTDGEGLRVVKVAEISSTVLRIPGVGRSHWMPDGRAIAFVVPTDRGSSGIFVQDFVVGRDTSSTRRRVEGWGSIPMSKASAFHQTAPASPLQASNRCSTSCKRNILPGSAQRYAGEPVSEVSEVWIDCAIGPINDFAISIEAIGAVGCFAVSQTGEFSIDGLK
jgi:Tol biopolymer transport system component